MAKWFYQTGEGRPSGPVDSTRLRRLAEAGIVRPDTLVRQGDSGRWVRAEQVRGLFQRSTASPSSSPGATPPGPPPLPPPVARRPIDQGNGESRSEPSSSQAAAPPIQDRSRHTARFSPHEANSETRRPMEPLKRLFATHPLIFSLLGIAIMLDLTGVVPSIRPGTSFALGSILVIAYFLGVSGVLRFAIARKPIDERWAWITIILLYFGWFMIQAALQKGQYRPSLLFVLCVVAAFKTLRCPDAVTSASATPIQSDAGDDHS